MTTSPRPLSPWVAQVSPDGVGLGPVNGGDDRADARALPRYATGWRRVAIPIADGGHALGLVDEHGTTVAELDDHGASIKVSLAAMSALARIEREWPVVDHTLTDEIYSLATEALSLRYWLLTRLDAEGDPPDGVFEILPWHLLDRAVAAVTAGLEPDGTLGELVEIRHWLTPAVRGLTGPLEQLDHGLRIGDTHIARLGATALLNSLRDLPGGRVPDSCMNGLRTLVGRLGTLDPIYRHAARFLTAALAGGNEVPRLQTELNPAMEPAAGTDELREQVEQLGDDTQQVRLVATRAGWIRVTARIAGGQAAGGPLAEQPALLLPVRVTPRNRGPALRFWLAMQPEGDRLVGSLNIALPDGVSLFDADDVPIGPDELTRLRPEELLPSLHASTEISADRWLEIADDLPHTHPMRAAATIFEASL
ncbi:hypothetical protein [Alloactinosynnema sp. L-07]|uniref:hypothetical protein n=1 Tax=Alloactinosynnema sp. L-07 TaxID=1653480 RepID=UPI00065EF97C|nr:hypothetical protein [Alloactinosynnema sp. L-07]CRK59326.1 hypothetical protein [Alloactinosynnema sp. L-07]